MTPTVLFDGTCPFCRRQVVRLKSLTRGRVAFESAYDLGAHFYAVPPVTQIANALYKRAAAKRMRLKQTCDDNCLP